MNDEYVPLTDDEIKAGAAQATNTIRFLINITDDGIGWSDAHASWNPVDGWYQ